MKHLEQDSTIRTLKSNFYDELWNWNTEKALRIANKILSIKEDSIRWIIKTLLIDNIEITMK